MSVKIGFAQHKGGRTRQEDCVAVLHPAPNKVDAMLLVADGMGGHPAGDHASRIVISEFLVDWLSQTSLSDSDLYEALQAANCALARAQINDPELTGMGSTCLVAIVSDNFLRWISVGDCLLYHFRSNQLNRLNADHSMTPMLDRMADAGEITYDAAQDHPDRHILMAALTGRTVGLIDNPTKAMELRPGDRILLASDGVLTINKAAMVACLGEISDAGPQHTVERLLDEVLKRQLPDQDNISILLADIEPPKATAPSLHIKDYKTLGVFVLALSGALLLLIVLITFAKSSAASALAAGG